MRWFPLLLLLLACASGETTLCERFYEPYPNLLGQRQRTAQNAAFLDAMAAYDQGDYAAAAVQLRRVVDKEHRNNPARMYLASALLATGDPYNAEMHLDFLERDPDPGFRDQVDWYNALCWLCSGQYARVLQQCQAIVNGPAHTYKAQAGELLELLTTK